MEWKLYFRNVVKRYHVIIEGWPSEIEFVNLSDASSSIDTLERLLRRWKQGTTYWKKLTQEEFEQLEDERDAQIESGKINVPAPRRTRSDKGKKRKSCADDDSDSDHDGCLDSNKRRKTRLRNSDDAQVGGSRHANNDLDGDDYEPDSADEATAGERPAVSQRQQAKQHAKR
jgi:hypothetical protein